MDPDIYGDRIMWRDDRNGKDDIYMYDISTFRETQITTYPTAKEGPAIYGDRIVWMDSCNGGEDPDIYMCALPPKTPVADFSASNLSGNIPLNVTLLTTAQECPLPGTGILETELIQLNRIPSIPIPQQEIIR